VCVRGEEALTEERAGPLRAGEPGDARPGANPRGGVCRLPERCAYPAIAGKDLRLARAPIDARAEP